MTFKQFTSQPFRIISEAISISHLQQGLQDWVRKQIVDDDPYEQQEVFFEQANGVNTKERLVNFQTKIFSLLSISESVKAFIIRDLKALQAYNSVMSQKKAYY